MHFFLTLLGDALLFGALIWFSGYGALGPVMGIRLDIAAKLRLFVEVVLLTAALLYLFITLDRITGWALAPPWPGSPPPHRLLALGAVLTVGFLYTRRRARALQRPPAAPTDDGAPS